MGIKEVVDLSARRSPANIAGRRGKLHVAKSEGSSIEDRTQSSPTSEKITPSALRSLSDLKSLTDKASSATNRVREVIGQAAKITAKLVNEVDPTKREALANEANTLLEEIDTISQSDGSVVDQGQLPYSVNLSANFNNSSNSLTVQFPNVGISKSSLGISSVSSSSIQDSPESTLDSLLTADSILSQTSAQLKSVDSAIQSTAEQYGLERSQVDSHVSADSADSLAAEIAKSLGSSKILAQSQNLDPLRVEELLK